MNDDAQDTPHAGQADWHTLPPWFERFQDRFVLSLLIIAGMVLNGLFFAHGIVADIEKPFWEWGVFHLLLFVTFFAAGTGITGVTLRASAAIGRSFRRGWEGVLPGVIYTVIAFGLFFPLEVWASITIRSVTALQTPADRWLLGVIGHPELPISPTVIAVALAAPLTVLVWGLVTSPPAQEDHDAHLARVRARQEAKLIKTEFGAKRNQARVAGWAAAAKGAAKELGMSAAEKSAPVEETHPPLPEPSYTAPMEAQTTPDDDPNPDDDGPRGGGGLPAPRPRPLHDPLVPVTQIKYPASARNGSRVANGQGIQPEAWDWRELADYVAASYGMRLTKAEAIELIKDCDYRRDAKRPGRPFVASRKQLEQKVRLHFGIRGGGSPKSARGERTELSA